MEQYKEAEGALIGAFQQLNAGIAGNRNVLAYSRNQWRSVGSDNGRE